MDKLESAVKSLKEGKMVAVYDGDEREGEADLIFHAGFATPEKIETAADVTLEKTEAGFQISMIELNVKACIQGINQEIFQKYADEALKNCPVGKALAAVEKKLNNVELE